VGLAEVIGDFFMAKSGQPRLRIERKSATITVLYREEAKVSSLPKVKDNEILKLGSWSMK
jgi:hypothetical protein